MTTTAPPTVQVTRGSQSIDSAVALLSQPDASIEDCAMLLRRVAVADPASIADSPLIVNRIQGLCAFVARRLREQYPDEIRCAPPAALVELVDDTASYCGFTGCVNRVLPWDADAPFCSPACRNDDMRERGE